VQRDGAAVRVLGERGPARRGAGAAGGERGAVMLFVLLAILLVGAVTVSVMQVISGDLSGGIEALEADQVFNVAQAGAHYAIGKLQLVGTAQNYAGETAPPLTISNGSTTLGTAVVTVSCIDTGLAPTATGCSGGASIAPYRRVISVGSLPVSGPSRMVVAVVKAASSSGGGSWTTGVCALSTINSYTSAGEVTNIGADIASNGSINLNPNPAAVGEGSIAGTVHVLAGSSFAGNVLAKTTAACATASGCTASGTVSGSGTNPGCSAPTIPAPGFAPGSGTTTLVAGAVNPPITCAPGTPPVCPAYGDVIVPAGSSAASYTVLTINAPTAGQTYVVQMNSLVMDQWTRLVVNGPGNVDLRLAKTTGTALQIGPYKNNGKSAQFGVQPASTDASPLPLAQASQLTVWVNSDGTSPNMSTSSPGHSVCSQSSSTTGITNCAAWISHNTGNATIIVPNGTVMVDDASDNTPTVPMKGAILGNEVDFMGNSAFTQDTSGLPGLSFPPGAYTNFKQLMSWKDQ